MKLGGKYTVIPTTLDTEKKEEGKYCDLFTDTGTFEILMSADELRKEIDECKKNNKDFKFKKLEEYSQTIEHYGEIILNVTEMKILCIKEHTIIHDRVKQKEVNLEKAKQEKTIAPKK